MDTAQPEGLSGIAKEAKDLLVLAGIAGIIMMMIVPLPPFMMDLLLVTSISFSILILLVSFYARKPMEFSVFPTMLLLSTLMRLALNIASTRLILLHGSEGESAAGEVIRAFGYFVVGGNYIVGIIVFAILIIINFVVITKGAGRIAEVAARFTLDAMPGKQLAIDADLNAGVINDKEAIRRREAVSREADFYGSMDGASKFVRGDAVAGIMITIVNIVGGFLIGVVQQNMPFMDALKVYTILTVGDGLVAQVPALIISVSAGLIVTKVSNDRKISEEIALQTFKKWRPLAMAGALLFLVAFIPGFPAIPFFTLSILLMASAYYVRQKHGHDLVESDLAASATTSGSKETAEHVVQKEDVPSLPDLLEVEVGYDLISIVDQKSGGEFPSRIVGIRKQLMNEMGVILPPVHIRDNLKLKASEYKIYLKGAVIAHGELIANHHLALDPGMTTRKIEGIATVDPTFGLPALWIPDVQKEAAIVAGYTVVDPASVLATHLMEIVRKNLHYLYGRQELSATLDRVKTTHPKIVTDLIPELLSLGIVLKVFQNLLHERVSVRDILTILETLAEYAPITKDPGDLTEYVRGALGRNISRQYIAADENLYAITLEKALEEKLTKSITHTQAGSTLSVDPQTAKHLVEQVGSEVKKNIANQHPPVVLTSQNVRPHLYKLIERFIPNLAVLAHGEVAGHVPVRPVGTINFSTAISSS